MGSLVNDNDELRSHVDIWDIPPVGERYESACRELGTTLYANLRSALTSSQASQRLEVSGLALRGQKHTEPLFR